MKKLFVSLIAILFLLTSCFEDMDDNAVSSTTINDFVWKAMNVLYLYNDSEAVSDLRDDRFGINGINNRYDFTPEYIEYLNNFSTPEALFSTLIDSAQDRFSLITPDYSLVLSRQEGVSITTGLRVFKVPRPDAISNEVYAAIGVVLNNSPANDLGLQRGQIFTAVDGVTLTEDNFETLLGQTTVTLNFADYNSNDPNDPNDDTLMLNGTTETLTAIELTENPIHRADILNIDDSTVGYLMYTSFNSNFENELNAAFGQFQTAGIDELVLDLRYNGGGAVQTAVYLGSMINNQNVGSVFSKLIFNSKLQSANEDFLFTNSFENGVNINGLNLQRLFVLTSENTASASELIINSLSAYMEVVVIGENTSGKTQANRLVLDSPGFSGTNVNVTHTYGLVPLIANSVNVNETPVPNNGITPNVMLEEQPFNLGTFGDVNEPLLATALALITNSSDADRSTTPLVTNSTDMTLNHLRSPYAKMMFLD